MKNELVKAGKREVMDVATILKDATQRAKLMSFIDEVIIAKTKILDQNETIKSLRDAAVEEFSIEPKMFNSVVSLCFNNNYAEKATEIERLQAVIELLSPSGE